MSEKPIPQEYSRFSYNQAENDLVEAGDKVVKSTENLYEIVGTPDELNRAFGIYLTYPRLFIAKRQYQKAEKRLQNLHGTSYDEAKALNKQYDALLSRYANGDTSVLSKIQEFEIEKLGKKVPKEKGETTTFRLGETHDQLVAAQGSPEKIKSILLDRLGELQSLRDLIWEMNKKDNLSKKEFNDIVEKTDPKEFAALYKHIIERIQHETNYFKIAKEIETYIHILEHKLEGKIADKKVSWKNKWLQLFFAGAYIPGFKAIFISESPPDKKRILKNFAKVGELPPPLRVLNHEIIHARQLDQKTTLEVLFTNLTSLSQRGLIEAQAYRAGSSGVASAAMPAKKLADQVKLSVPPQIKTKSMTVAVEAVDKLSTLNLDQREIAKLIADSNGAKKIKVDGEAKIVFPKLEERAQQEMKLLGLDEADMKALATIHLLENEVTTLRAQQIALQEIKRDKQTNRTK